MASDSGITRRAVIDVGTNSVKLLVADLTAESVIPILETSEQTRLGRGFYQAHLLQPEAIKLTASVVSRFAAQARELRTHDVRVFATSAARDAHNAGDLIYAIRDTCGLDLSIIGGDVEAEWAFQGAATHPALKGHLVVLVDIGGGSTEFILGRSGHRHFSQSFALGTVRTIESLPHADPPTKGELAACREQVGQFIAKEVQPRLNPALDRERRRTADPPRLAVTGGTATILAAMELALETFDRDRIEAVCLTANQVTNWVNRLWALPLSERRQLPGLPPPRADVILAGTVVLESTMQTLGFHTLHVSTRGPRFVALRELWSPAVHSK